MVCSHPELLAFTTQKVALCHSHRAVGRPVPILAALKTPAGTRHRLAGGRCGHGRGMRRRIRGDNLHGPMGPQGWGSLTSRLVGLDGLLCGKLNVQKALHLLDKDVLGPIVSIQGHLLQCLER